jgi:hypothetical protein
MPTIPQRLLSPHVSRVFRRRVLSILCRSTSNFRAMNYQLHAIKMKSNRSLASRIAAGSADAGNITVAYCMLSPTSLIPSW